LVDAEATRQSKSKSKKDREEGKKAVKKKTGRHIEQRERENRRTRGE